MSSSVLRLSKLLSQKGLCSRREADVWIQKGWVLVNGSVIKELGTKVDEKSEITLKKEAQKEKSQKLTFILNKPLGYVSCQPEKGYPASIDLLKEANRDQKLCSGSKLPSYLPKLAVAGRLDINSQGLLVITQDGTLAKKLIGNPSNVEKEYLVRVDKPIESHHLKQLEKGLILDEKPLKKASVKRLGVDYFRIILTEGRKRQIRRMCELVGLQVKAIKRVRIGQIRLERLQLGKWRLLKEGESF